MSEERNWREAKIPNWVKDAMLAETANMRKTIALSWPQEPEPEPAPFQWGEYDRLLGEAVAGVYWKVGHRHVEKTEIAKNDQATPKWKQWMFKYSDGDWTTSVPRGALYLSERDARLAVLWKECNDCAERLMKARKGLYSA